MAKGLQNRPASPGGSSTRPGSHLEGLRMTAAEKIEEVIMDLLVLSVAADLPELEEQADALEDLLRNPLLYIQ